MPTAEAELAHTAAAPEGADELYCVTDVRILVIDDEAAISKVIKAALAQPGFMVDTAGQPAEIEAALKAQPYHLVVTDYVLPGLPPDRLFALLHAEQPDASVIVITGYPSMDSAVASLRSRVYDYLTKPFTPEQIRTAVRRCLEARGLLRLSEEALRENLGSCIREKRKGQGLTLAQLAERAKVSLGYLSQVELGKNSASIETLYRICLALGIKMGDLFAGIRN